MEIKYTLRDFFVYFLTGFYLLTTVVVFLLNLGHNSNVLEILKYFFKINNIAFIFIISTVAYIVGHIVHSLDWLIWELGYSTHDVRINNPYKNSIKNASIGFSKLLTKIVFVVSLIKSILIRMNLIIGVLFFEQNQCHKKLNIGR